VQEADGPTEWAAKAKIFTGPIRRGAAALRLRWSVIDPEATGVRAEAAKAAKAAKGSRAQSKSGLADGGKAQSEKSRLGEKGTAAAAAHQAAEAAVRSPYIAA
jgi:hypothetical protein